jgi:alanine or glycine:cation symporter, AGCS family
MLNNIINTLIKVDTFFWDYIGVYLILLPGVYFTIKTKGFQFRVIRNYKNVFSKLHKIGKQKDEPGISPFKLYFASVGGMIGLGNMVAVVTAVTIGGPGALVWLWIAAIAGMLIKYSEVYLGITHRVKNKKHGYDGGSMFYLRHAFGNKVIPIMACIMLCIYGVEVFQFKVINDTISQNFKIDSNLVLVAMLALTIYTGLGGIKRVANICSVLMPPFMILYIVMCLWIIVVNYQVIPQLLLDIAKYAFYSHAPIGGFVGSSILVTMHYGIARAVYSGDIAIGYDSVVQSETRSKFPELQAKLAVFGQLTDVTICTFSLLIILVTGVWYDPSLKNPSEVIMKALSLYFPYIDIFMTVLFFLAGYTTILAYFGVGMKSASYISAKWGKAIYITYAVIALISTKFIDQANLIMIMSICAGMLVLLNIAGILKLRKEIKFRLL